MALTSSEIRATNVGSILDEYGTQGQDLCDTIVAGLTDMSVTEDTISTALNQLSSLVQLSNQFRSQARSTSQAVYDRANP